MNLTCIRLDFFRLTLAITIEKVCLHVQVMKLIANF